MMGLRSVRVVPYDNEEITIAYNLLSSVLTVRGGGVLLLRKGIWLPYQRLQFSLNNQVFELKVRTFPLCRFSLFCADEVVCVNIFPRLRRKSLTMWALTPARLTAAILSKVLS